MAEDNKDFGVVSKYLGLKVDIDDRITDAIRSDGVLAIIVVEGEVPGIVRITKPTISPDAVLAEYKTLLGGIHVIGDPAAPVDENQLVVSWMVRAIKRSAPIATEEKTWDYTWDHGYLFLKAPDWNVPGRNPPNLFSVDLSGTDAKVRAMRVQ